MVRLSAGELCANWGLGMQVWFWKGYQVGVLVGKMLLSLELTCLWTLTGFSGSSGFCRNRVRDDCWLDMAAGLSLGQWRWTVGPRFAPSFRKLVPWNFGSLVITLDTPGAPSLSYIFLPGTAAGENVVPPFRRAHCFVPKQFV